MIVTVIGVAVQDLRVRGDGPRQDPLQGTLSALARPSNVGGVFAAAMTSDSRLSVAWNAAGWISSGEEEEGTPLFLPASYKVCRLLCDHYQRRIFVFPLTMVGILWKR